MAKWTTASALKEFLRREQDVVDKHRMAGDAATNVAELAQGGFTQMPDGSVIPTTSLAPNAQVQYRR